MNITREVGRGGEVHWTNPPRIGSVGRVVAKRGGWMAMVWPEGAGLEATEIGLVGV